MNGVEMSTPVTHGELREELARFEMRFDQLDARFGELEQRFDHKLDRRLGELEQRFDHKLEMWGGALLARITESEQRALARDAESKQRALESEQRMLTEIARHIRAANEAMIAQLSVIDEKYTDLPARVRRVEAKVFAAKRR